MTFAEPAVRRVSSRVVYRNGWMSVREDQVLFADGSPGVYGVVDKDDFALVIPAERGGFWLVEQYRYPIGARRWEFPQGTFDPGAGGSPADLAAAELAEETGLRAGALTHLGHLHCAYGMSSQGFDVFVATDLAAGRPQRGVAEQDMRQRWLPRAEFERMIRAGEITDDSSLAAYTLYLLAGAGDGG
jgi:8-oxo-dGTP pyrophosphatase MutT (NUDIX family)